MKSSAICSLLFSIVLVLLICHAEAKKGKGGKNLIACLCKEFKENRANCMRAVGSDPNVLKAQNSLQLAQAILPIAEKKAIEGQNFLKGIAASNNSTDMAICVETYGSVAQSFKGVLDIVSRKYSDQEELIDNVTAATYEAAVAGDEPARCGRVLETGHVVNPAISALNSEMGLFCSIASEATNTYERFLKGI